MTTFLKLGGSVITDKAGVRVARLETIQRLATEISQSLQEDPAIRLVLGHGSGSFGHAIAAEHNTHLGASSDSDWSGFASVWQAARELNSIVIEALVSAGLPAIAFPPSASAMSEAGRLVSMTAEPIQSALSAGLLPVVYGDVIFDNEIGTSIASTEEVFRVLAKSIQPSRLLLAGRADGVYETMQDEPRLLTEITPDVRAGLEFTDPEGEDVTGGMAAKVDICLELASTYPDLEILIFSAEQPGQIRDLLLGQSAGTRIRA